MAVSYEFFLGILLQIREDSRPPCLNNSTLNLNRIYIRVYVVFAQTCDKMYLCIVIFHLDILTRDTLTNTNVNLYPVFGPETELLFTYSKQA